MTELNDLLTNLTAIQAEYSATLGGLTSALDVALWAQENFPYWTNAVQRVDLDEDSEVIQLRTYTLVMRFHLGFLTENYQKVLEESLLTIIPNALTYFDARRWLTCATQKTRPIDLDPRGSRMVSAQVIRVQTGGTSGQILAIDFTIEVPFKIYIDQIEF